jgi:YbgC/YbaW family acyl-CoA thioester hydrolase
MQIVLPITVIAFETDFAGVVSNTRFLEYIERGRYALLHSAGLRLEKIWAEQDVQPVVRHVEVDYLGFARHEEELELTVSVADHAGARSVLNYELRRKSDGTVLMKAIQTLAYLNKSWRPVRVPPVFRDAMQV